MALDRINATALLDGGITSADLATQTGNVDFADNARIRLGDSQDLQIYHDGSHSYIEDAGEGSLFIKAQDFIVLENTAGDNYFAGETGGPATLYHAGVRKLQTTTTGVDVTGTVASDELRVDGSDFQIRIDQGSNQPYFIRHASDNSLRLHLNGTGDRVILTSSGVLLVGKPTATITTAGQRVYFGQINGTIAGDNVCTFNRLTDDGTLVDLRQDSVQEGTISVSGTLVSYNGGHLARWSQLADGTRDETIVKGTVLTNLDQMAVWHHEAVAAQDAVLDEEGNVVTEAVEAKDAYTEDNEQLNCMAVSSVEGDPNVAGVFVNWDNDDDDFNDMNIAMTGDAIIRIAQGTTVARGDLLMSAGDGTAKPQGDDIVRSKTIAKVTSTNVSHTYDDGSYLVPCVLMACQDTYNSNRKLKWM